MRGFFNRGVLGAILGLIGISSERQIPAAANHPDAEMPKANRVGGGHRGSKPRRDSTIRIRARKRWLKKRKRNSRRGVYTVRGFRG